jgi:dolichol-phosphate mannosyltransferase
VLRKRIAICMPVFNESSGIKEFLLEIYAEFESHDVYFFLIDDFSTDSTQDEIQELSRFLPISYRRNERNLGHGPSTIRALQFALSSGCEFILAVDGDGQFHGTDLRLLAELCIGNKSDIGLGIRVRSNEKVYRKMTSWVTRTIVSMKTKSKTSDANTPLRFYARASLQALLADLKSDNPIPNLYISVRQHELDLKIATLKVEFRPRRGEDSQSTSWGKSILSFPTKRFLKFCFKSMQYWIKN